MSSGVSRILNFFTTCFVSGSMRATVRSSRLSTQTEPSPTATLLGALPVRVNEASCASAPPSAATPLPTGPASEPPPPVRAAKPATAATARSDPPADSSRPCRRRARRAAAGRPPVRRGRVRPRRLDQLGAAGGAVVAVLGERLAQHRVERGVALQRRRLLLHVRPQRLGLGRAPERRRAGQALVQHAGERVHVASARRPARRGSARAPGSRACPPCGPVSVESPPSCLVTPKSVR